jgi:hypothetical protein
MNTKETTGESSKEFKGDKLDRIFEAQASLMARYKPIAEEHWSKVFKQPSLFSEEAWKGGEFNLHTREGNVLIKDMIEACMQELAEAVQTMKNWKPWKMTEMPSDADHWKEEMIDALHFYVEAMQLAGVTPDEMHDLYFKKKEVNEFRQDSKY